MRAPVYDGTDASWKAVIDYHSNRSRLPGWLPAVCLVVCAVVMLAVL